MEKRTTMLILLIAGLATMIGCEEDQRLAQMAQDATRRQAEQNQEMIRLNRDVAASHQRVIEADAQSRQEVLQVQRELIARDEQGRQEVNALQRDSQTSIHQERSSLDHQHEKLDNERKEIAQQRNRDPIVAAAIAGLGVILACLAPIVLAIYLLRTVHRQEPSDAELAELLVQESGLQVPGAEQPADAGGNDPLAAIRSINALAGPESSAILVLQNFHRFTGSVEIVQALAQQIVAGKQNRCFIVVLAPRVDIPCELEELFVVLDHDLPSRDQLEEIARGIATEDGELPEGDTLETILDAGAGLTRYEAEGAFSLSLVRHGRIQADAIWELKSGMLKKSGLVQLHRGGEAFDQLGGLDNLKAFCLRAMRRQVNRDPLCRPQGVLLLSPPGCGKSQFAKSLGNEVGRPTLTLDVGSLLGSLVGQSEQNMRQALKISDAMAPCVLFCDEIEKALSGVASSGQTDSGVSARLFGNLLSWLNDHTSDVFFVGTCNDISRLPPEFARSERFDGVFFIDLPNASQRNTIWRIYIELFGLDPEQPRPQDNDWTGAEIKSCCRLATLLDVPLIQAAQNVVPIAVTAAESVDRLRNWASGRCLDADDGGIFRRNGAARAKPGRKVRRSDPSNN